MMTKHKGFLYSDDIVLILRIIISKMCKHIDFYVGLVIELFLVSNYLESYIFL